MKAIIMRGLIPLLLLGGLAAPLSAAEPTKLTGTYPRTGLGIIVGEPTGLTLKWWRSRQEAIALAAAWSLSDNDSLVLNADYLLHDPTLMRGKVDAEVGVYYGLGLHLKFREDKANTPANESDTFVGVRVPLGINHFLSERVELFAELVPGLNLIPDTDLDLDLALGARYTFD